MKIISNIRGLLPISRGRAEIIMSGYETNLKQQAEIIRSLIEEMGRLTKVIQDNLGAIDNKKTPKNNDRMFG